MEYMFTVLKETAK